MGKLRRIKEFIAGYRWDDYIVVLWDVHWEYDYTTGQPGIENYHSVVTQHAYMFAQLGLPIGCKYYGGEILWVS